MKESVEILINYQLWATFIGIEYFIRHTENKLYEFLELDLFLKVSGELLLSHNLMPEL